MEGIRITGQTLYTEDRPEDILPQVHSILVSKNLDVQGFPNSVTGESFLNSVEVKVQPYQNGTTITVDYGLTTIGVILAVIGLIALLILGVVILALWYIKMDELKSTFRHSFPAFMPPPPHTQQTPPPDWE